MSVLLRASELEGRPIVTFAGESPVSEWGTALGKVEDVDFDEGSGTFVGFDLGAAGSVASDRLLGLGSYAVVVREVSPGEAPPGGS